jgi:hypothetical protein
MLYMVLAEGHTQATGGYLQHEGGDQLFQGQEA